MDLTSAFTLTHNTRGLGGIATADGSAVRDGVLFRADALAALDATGVEAFARFGIGTVIDLRTDAERARAADVLPADGSVRLVPLPVLGGAMDEMAKQMLSASDAGALPAERMAEILAQVPTLEQLYVSILDSSAHQFAVLARAVIDASTTDRPGVLFHCTAGKDRTGLAAALLLLVAGVDRDAIVADYTLTGKNLAGPFADALAALVTSTGIPLTPALRTLATESPAAAITAALDWIDTQHGGASGYLQSGGLSPEEVATLRLAVRSG